MPEWLNDSIPTVTSGTAWGLALTLGMALLYGLIIAAIHRITRGRRGSIATLPATLVVLSVLIAVVTQVIGDHVARAFSLVGALSIVRFRTVVEDTFDIAFVIFAVVMGMAVGADQWMIAGVGTAVTGLASFLAPLLFENRGTRHGGQGFLLTVRTYASSPSPMEGHAGLWRELFASTILNSARTVRSGTAIEYEYRVFTRNGHDPEQVLHRLRGADGVTELEIKLH